MRVSQYCVLNVYTMWQVEAHFERRTRERDTDSPSVPNKMSRTCDMYPFNCHQNKPVRALANGHRGGVRRRAVVTLPALMAGSGTGQTSELGHVNVVRMPPHKARNEPDPRGRTE